MMIGSQHGFTQPANTRSKDCSGATGMSGDPAAPTPWLGSPPGNLVKKRSTS